jgi:hypothetical protein
MPNASGAPAVPAENVAMTEWLMLVIFVNLGGPSSNMPPTNSMLVERFATKETCERVVRDLESWADKTYRRGTVVIGRLDAVCIKGDERHATGRPADVDPNTDSKANFFDRFDREPR